MPKQIGEDTLEPTDALLSSVAPAQEVGQEDEVVLLGRSHETRLLKKGSQAEEDGGAEACVEGQALNQQVLTLLQFCHRLHDGRDQPDLRSGRALFVQHIDAFRTR